ncbi:DUF4365 domain-containing protein [Candidatus Enterococcus murrayae]|uniref:DUF4365 domain-containing protein n=1 Tax=Candidatus Enterococcus murrayae TaxID=2815321 RepID=A0ABS3HIW0_9ENTE|nr:DUF4365 domain-containing protein [Enterococcus sp. MJM16]MBO0453401.1 DUF4365 domain-containing protein [Enterococcus sp. MJM16]
MLVEMKAIPTIEDPVALLDTRLSKLCTVNKLQDSFGIDFLCLYTSEEETEGKEFFVQYKAAKKIAEDEEAFLLQLDTSTVRRWFKKRCVTFLFYVDPENRAIYWVDPFEQLFKRVRELSKKHESIVLAMPKTNLLQAGQKLPKAFLERIYRFDHYLFTGAIERINMDIETFSKEEYFSDELIVEETEDFIEINYKNVHLNASYPDQSGLEGKGNCCIRFTRQQENNEDGIHFSHKEILDLFYFGKETEAKLGMRKFIKLYLEELDQYFADFGNSIAYLYPNEVDELCAVVDIFIEKYVEKITAFLKKLESFAFEPYRGSHRNFKLMQLDIDLWDRIREHVKQYQTSNGSYDDGYIFTPFEDNNRIGLEDERGRELFNVYGSYEQSPADREKLVVNVIWEYIDYSEDSEKPEQPYNVADTYAFFINDLLPKFLTNEFTVRKKRLFGTKLIKVYKTLTKEEIEKKIFVPKYKLTQYPNSNSELASTFYYLSEYMKEKDFYSITPSSFEDLLQDFDRLVQAELSIGGQSAKAWYQKKKNDLLEDLTQIQQGQEKEPLSEGYFLANIFSNLQVIVRQYKGSFDGKRIRESELLKDFSAIIADYNEDRLIRLLIS